MATKTTIPALQPSTPAEMKSAKKDRRLVHMQHQERKALEKLERIKTWPKDKQEEATVRTQAKLNNIREEMKKCAS